MKIGTFENIAKLSTKVASQSFSLSDAVKQSTQIELEKKLLLIQLCFPMFPISKHLTFSWERVRESESENEIALYLIYMLYNALLGNEKNSNSLISIETLINMEKNVMRDIFFQSWKKNFSIFALFFSFSQVFSILSQTETSHITLKIQHWLLLSKELNCCWKRWRKRIQLTFNFILTRFMAREKKTKENLNVQNYCFSAKTLFRRKIILFY